jgi:2',3'-cyclic-nucleotide 2'-phosphodiesterase (5'-nucleotidase family)
MMGKAWVLVTVLVAAGVWLASSGVGQADKPAADQPLSTQGAAVGEVSFGDLTADSLCAVGGAALALAPAVTFRDGGIAAGPLDQAAVAALLQKPDETWAVSRLTGAQIVAALERSVSRTPLPNGAFLQVAGLAVAYDPKGPRDGRVKQVLLAAVPIAEDQTYEVAMPLSLAKGGSGYFQIFDESSIVRRGTQGLADAIYDFAKAKGHVSYTGQGRILESR